MPVAFVAAGVMGLIGCIYIPATRQFQSTGQPRPESLIGKAESSKPLKLGRTRIDEALPVLQRSVWLNTGSTPIDEDPRFAVHFEKRQISVSFSVVTGRLVGICGGDTDLSYRALIVEFDADGIIIGYHTLTRGDAEASAFRRFQSGDALRLFGPDRTHAMEQAGILMSPERRRQDREAEELQRIRRGNPPRAYTTAPSSRAAPPSTLPWQLQP